MDMLREEAEKLFTRLEKMLLDEVIGHYVSKTPSPSLPMLPPEQHQNESEINKWSDISLCNYFFSFLIQTATTAPIDPDYNFDFTAGTHANTTYKSQNICSGKNYGCIIGFFDGFKQNEHRQQIAAGLSEYNTGYDEGYKDGISNANSGEDIGTDEIPDICAHFTQHFQRLTDHVPNTGWLLTLPTINYNVIYIFDLRKLMWFV
jgi:hypothetical protein